MLCPRSNCRYSFFGKRRFQVREPEAHTTAKLAELPTVKNRRVYLPFNCSTCLFFRSSQFKACILLSPSKSRSTF